MEMQKYRGGKRDSLIDKVDYFDISGLL